MTSAQSPADATPLPSMPESYISQAVRLVASVDGDPWGSVRPSVYETARVISLAPWLPGHDQRITWLLNEQGNDGSWGEGPKPHRLLPTLSAVEAVLSVLGYGAFPGRIREELESTAADGLAALRSLPPAGPWPDTAAIEILVPSLVVQINEHQDQPAIRGLPRLGAWSRGARLTVPRGFDGALPDHVGQRCRSAGVLPAKLQHTLEGIARHAPIAEVRPAGGLIGSSPAATAAWAAAATDPHSTRAQAVTQLSAVARRYDGLFPEAAPIAVFERLWVAAALAGPGLPAPCLPAVRAWTTQIYDPAGVRGAPGLLPDADDTAMAILVSALAGQPRDPAPLAAFEARTHYHCYIGEDTGSVSANAHALRALGSHVQRRPETGSDHRTGMNMARDWLLAQQTHDGAWTDKWHASPYYATERCVTALAQYGGRHAVGAVRSAADWILSAQGTDGSWGVWGGTAEETAYAVKVLLLAQDGHEQSPVLRALDRAEAILRAAVEDPAHRHPALWHDKTLYAPQAMIHAEVVAALEMLRTRRR